MADLSKEPRWLDKSLFMSEITYKCKHSTDNYTPKFGMNVVILE